MMAISPGQAAAALQDIEQTERRTRVSSGYAAASPHLILWGVIWAIGFAGCAFMQPERWGLVWLPLVLVGSMGSTWFGSRDRRAPASGRPSDARLGARAAAGSAAIFLFFVAFFSLIHPVDPRAGLVFPVMTMGLIYCLGGIFAGLSRFVWIGGSAFALAIAGYLAAPEWTALWAAAAGGGGLVLGGLWLRRV